MKVSIIRLFGKALKRVPQGLPKIDFIKNKHGACVNFDNGTCKVFHFTNLDPNGQACPHFKANTLAETENKTRDLEK